LGTDQKFVAAARHAFREDGTETPGVRSETLAAWRRSRAAGVPMSGTPDLRYEQQDFDHDSLLLRAVTPVAEQLVGQFEASEIAMVVTDRDARIVGRWIAGPLMRDLLDRQGALPGVVFDESCVGSTGLGTVLESGGLSVVDGTEHYNDSFDGVVAVGAPIIHPGTGVLEGVVDVVCPTGAPVELMLPLIAAAAKQAGSRLVSGYAREDRELLDAFMQNERRGPRRPVIALNGRMIIANADAGRLLGDSPHPLLWEEVHRAITAGHDYVDLSDGSDGQLRMAQVREVRSLSGGLGAVLQVVSSEGPPTTVARESPRQDAVAAKITRTLAGRSPHWASAVRGVAKAAVRGERLLLSGPTGVGKSALALVAAHALEGPGETAVVDAAALPTSIPDVSAVVVDGLEVLDLDGLSSLGIWLDCVPPAGSFVVGTMRTGHGVDVPPDLAAQFENSVVLPPLAHRVADIGVLAQDWAVRSAEEITLAAEALHELMRRSWPGNVRQLFRTLEVASACREDSVLRSHDLPEGHSRQPTRSSLTYLENVERDAIAALLETHAGNKNVVARQLGIARSTLYRKLAALGLDA
jgi:sigma-54 dependent transcriptional regulator, acetoin dehydrogenase operon transcriptional activator AcoR